MYSASNPLPNRILAMSILRVLLYLFQLFVSIALFGALIPVVAVSRLMELAILAVHPLSLFLLRQASNLIICTTLQTANWIWSISQVTMVKTSPSNLGPTTIDAIGITDAEEEGEELRQHRPEVLQPEAEAEPVASAPGTSQKLKELGNPPPIQGTLLSTALNCKTAPNCLSNRNMRCCEDNYEKFYRVGSSCFQLRSIDLVQVLVPIKYLEMSFISIYYFCKFLDKSSQIKNYFEKIPSYFFN